MGPGLRRTGRATAGSTRLGARPRWWGKSDDFHDYAVHWDASGVTWLLDDREHHHLGPADVPGPWPFDHPFFLVVNLAIGGDWPGQERGHPELPAVMLVDSIRVDAVPQA